MYTVDTGRTADSGFRRHLAKTFAWMGVGLLTTAVVAYAVYATDLWIYLVSNPIGIWAPLVLELGTVFFLSAKLHSMKATTSYIAFFFYAIVTGVTFSIYPIIYGLGTIFMAFGFTAVLFGSMAVIGMTTSVDLTKYRTLFMFGLIFLVAATVLGMFIDMGTFEMVLCYIGIGLFLAITAYDMQVIRKNYALTLEDGEMEKKVSIMGALNLYLDFINIFLYVLRLLGSRSNN